MKRAILLAAASLAFVALAWAFEVIRMDSLENLYGPVEFTHEAHMDYAGDCAVCHHHSDEPVSCSECHRKITVYHYEGAQRKTGIGLKGAYHGLCLGCHREVGGPMGCEDCHTRKEASR